MRESARESKLLLYGYSVMVRKLDNLRDAPKQYSRPACRAFLAKMMPVWEEEAETLRGRIRAIDAVLDSLPTGARNLLRRHYINHESWRKIAAREGKSWEACRKAGNRALHVFTERNGKRYSE